MRTVTRSAAWILTAAAAVAAGTQSAHAEPLTPLSPLELQFLDQLHRVWAVTPDDPVSFRSDGELLNLGRSACVMRDDHGIVGKGGSFVPPAVTQLAFIYLCPR